MALRGLASRRVGSVVGLAVAIALLWRAPTASADIIRGVQKILMGVFELPLDTLAGTFTGPPIIGTLMGAVGGLFKGLGLVLNGTLEVAMGGLSLAKAIAPYLLPIFL